MSVLDKAKGHYKAKMSREPRKLAVPEWGCDVYIKPGINLNHLGEIMELANSGKSAEAMAMTAIYRLVDAEDKPVFKRLDKIVLMQEVDPDVLARIVAEINSDDPDQEDAAGN